MLFLAPEDQGSALGFLQDVPSMQEIEKLRDWDVALRYHEFKTAFKDSQITRKLRKISTEAVLKKAQAILGSTVKPVWKQSEPALDSREASDYEMDLDETLDASPFVDEFWIEKTFTRQQPLVISVDTSLSMNGEKLALTAVALAVVLLEFPDDPIGIIAFENAAKVIKKPFERITIYQLVERFLDIPAQGYTHLEDGVKASIQMLQRLHTKGVQGMRPPAMVLLTDGKYTAGRDPSYLAHQIDHLWLLKMGKDRASRALCQELAKLGHGTMKEVQHIESLPGVMYSLVKELLRGRSLRS